MELGRAGTVDVIVTISCATGSDPRL